MLAERVRTAIIVIVLVMGLVMALPWLRHHFSEAEYAQIQRSPDPGNVLFLVTWTGRPPEQVLYTVAGGLKTETGLSGSHWLHQVPLVSGSVYVLSALQLDADSFTTVFVIPARGPSCTANNARGADGSDGNTRVHCQTTGG